MSQVIGRTIVVAAVLAGACGTEGPEHKPRTDASTRVSDASTVDSTATARDGALASDASALSDAGSDTSTPSDGGSDGVLSDGSGDGSTSRTCKTAVPTYVDLEVGGSTTFTTSDGKTHTVTLKSQSLDAVTVAVDGASSTFDVDENRCGSPGRQLPKNINGVQVLPEVTSDIEKVAACDPEDGIFGANRRWRHLKVSWETGNETADKDIEDPGYARLRLSDPDASLPFAVSPVASVKTCGQLLDEATSLFLKPVSYGFHAGVDFPLPVGTPLVAVRPGIVVRIDRSCTRSSTKCHSCGNHVVIEDDTYGTWHCHMQSVSEGLSEGQTVAAGEYLGESGTSGNRGFNGTSPHLHFNMTLNARTDVKRGLGLSVNPFPLLDAWCKERTCTPKPSIDSPRRMRSFRLSTAADASGKETGDAYCAAKGLKCLSVDRLWHDNDDKWLGFESDSGDWYAYGCNKKVLTDANSNGTAKVVNCYGHSISSSGNELQLFGIHDPLAARGKTTAAAYCNAKGLGSAGTDWLYAEKGSNDPPCWYGGSPKKWWCPFGTPQTLRSHWKSANKTLTHDTGLAREVYCVGREEDTTDTTHAVHRYYFDAASQAGGKSANQLCSERGMTCLGVERLYREGCAHDGWCTGDELESKVKWAQWKHHRCTDSVGNTKYDGLARVVTCRAPAGG